MTDYRNEVRFSEVRKDRRRAAFDDERTQPRDLSPLTMRLQELASEIQALEEAGLQGSASADVPFDPAPSERPLTGRIPRMADGVMSFEGSDYPLISTRKNGDRLIGFANTMNAEYLHQIGRPPVHGLSAKTAGTDAVKPVRIGQRLRIRRKGDTWVVFGPDGQIGHLRWRPSDEAYLRSSDSVAAHYPVDAVVVVRRIVVSADGEVVNFAGMLAYD